MGKEPGEKKGSEQDRKIDGKAHKDEDLFTCLKNGRECHAELVSASKQIKDQTLKRVQGDN